MFAAKVELNLKKVLKPGIFGRSAVVPWHDLGPTYTLVVLSGVCVIYGRTNGQQLCNAANNLDYHPPAERACARKSDERADDRLQAITQTAPKAAPSGK